MAKTYLNKVKNMADLDKVKTFFTEHKKLIAFIMMLLCLIVVLSSTMENFKLTFKPPNIPSASEILELQQDGQKSIVEKGFKTAQGILNSGYIQLQPQNKEWYDKYNMGSGDVSSRTVVVKFQKPNKFQNEPNVSTLDKEFVYQVHLYASDKSGGEPKKIASRYIGPIKDSEVRGTFNSLKIRGGTQLSAAVSAAYYWNGKTGPFSNAVISEKSYIAQVHHDQIGTINPDWKPTNPRIVSITIENTSPKIGIAG